MNKNLTELIGTFFLVLVIGLTGNPIAIGSILMVMIYMGGPISGAHYNPAVTLAGLIRKRITMNAAIQYWISQCIGAILAAVLFYLIRKEPMNPPASAEGYTNPMALILMEAIFTFALASVVLNVAMSKKSAGNSYFGLAIGFTVLASAYAAGPITGGAFNPAVAIGPSIGQMMFGDAAKASMLWVYLVGPLAGGAIAAIVYKWMNPDEE